MRDIEKMKEDLIKLQNQEMEYRKARESFNFNIKMMGEDRYFSNDIDSYLDAKLFIYNYSIIDKLFDPRCTAKEEKEILDTVKKDGLNIEDIVDRFLLYDRCGFQDVFEKEESLLKESKRIDNVMFPTASRKVINNCVDAGENIKENITGVVKTNINKGSKVLVKALNKVVKSTE